MARTRTSALTETRSAGKGQPSRPSPSGLASRSPTTTGITTPPVSGAEGREGFARLLDRIEGNGVTIVVVEDASRFARDLVVQELGIALLDKRGVRPLTTSGNDLTDSDDLGRKMMRQVAGDDRPGGATAPPRMARTGWPGSDERSRADTTIAHPSRSACSLLLT
jgi:Resolvase, N terminal domain